MSSLPADSPLPRPVLRGPTLTLRPLAEHDAEAMHAATEDLEARRLTGSLRSFTLEEVQAHCRRVQAATDRVDYAIVRPPDDRMLGEAVLNMIDRQQRCANFRILLADRSLYGQGIGTEATRLIVDHGFAGLGLHRIELEVFDFNPRAQRAYEKAGFVLEGRRRDALLWDGAFHDSLLMSILQPEWAARR